jgi:hypothetical protein
MPDDLFSGLGPFADNLTNERRGKLALRLTKACAAAPEPRAASQALGSLFDPLKVAEALFGLNGMLEHARKAVRADYERRSRLSRD